MSAEELSLVSSQNGLNAHSHTHSQLLFHQDDNLRFNCGGAQPSRHGVAGDSSKTTRELAAIIDDKLFSSNPSAAAVNTATSFPSTAHHLHHQQQGQTQPSPQDFRRNMYRRGPQEIDESDSEEDDEEEDDDVDDVDNMNGGGGFDRENSSRNGLQSSRSNNNGAGTSSCNANNASTSAATITNRANLDKLGNGNGKSKYFPCFGSGEELMVVKEGVGCIGKVENNNGPGVTIAEPDGDSYYPQYLQGTTEACGGSGRKEGSSFLSESGESLRAILSDPVTGALMDDAMILPCGHSFGTGGIHHVFRLKACYSCAQSISEDSIMPNLSLRAAVQAFRREEELQLYRSPKRKRDRFDQDKGSFGDLTVMDHPRSRGVQFPFAVADRVVIKGNKRTPERFVGREAVVTTQCLNGWYVVKTLDNAESVKLQYRSLARISNDPSSKANPSKTTPSWLQSS